MNMLQQLTSQTPIWVWLLLAFLVTRGIAAMKPGETSLQKLAIVPVLFAVWGAWSISHRFGASLNAWGEWLAGIGTGAALGWLLLGHVKLTLDGATGKLWRNADFSLLPLLLITFLVKYGFAVAARQCRFQCRLPAVVEWIHRPLHWQVLPLPGLAATGRGR